VAASALVMNTFLMRHPLTQTPPVTFAGFRSAQRKWHIWGWLGGAIWCTGTVLNFVASHARIVGPAVSYAIGQGATMVSALWGVFVWREFATAPRAARQILWPCLYAFFWGLVL